MLKRRVIWLNNIPKKNMFCQTSFCYFYQSVVISGHIDIIVTTKKTNICFLDLVVHLWVIKNILLLNGTILEEVFEFRLMGIEFDCHLEWENEFVFVGKKILQSKYILLQPRVLSPLKTLKMLYNSFVQSHLQYAIMLWLPLLIQMQKDEIGKLQINVVRIMLFKNQQTHCKRIVIH
jgi:hypothetical protein